MTRFDEETELMKFALGDLYSNYNRADLTSEVINGDFIVRDRGVIVGKIDWINWIKPRWM